MISERKGVKMNKLNLEEQIENLLTFGKSNSEIAGILIIEPEKVKTILRSIYTKHKVNNRLQLAIKLVKEKC